MSAKSGRAAPPNALRKETRRERASEHVKSGSVNTVIESSLPKNFPDGFGRVDPRTALIPLEEPPIRLSLAKALDVESKAPREPELQWVQRAPRATSGSTRASPPPGHVALGERCRGLGGGGSPGGAVQREPRGGALGRMALGHPRGGLELLLFEDRGDPSSNPQEFHAGRNRPLEPARRAQ